MAIRKFNTVAGLSVGPDASIDVIDQGGNITAQNLTATGLSELGDVGNVKILGGTSGYVLSTDGSGNLTWVTNDTGVAGSNTQVQFNDQGVFGSSASFVFDKTSNTLSVINLEIIENSNLGNLATANFVTGTLTTASQPNITTVGTLTDLSVTGNVIAGYLAGDGSNISNIYGPNVIGEVPNANYAVYSLFTFDSDLANLANQAVQVTGSSQPNITSVGDLGGLVVLGTANLNEVTTNILTSNALISNSTLFVAGDATIDGNLIVNGNAVYADVKNLYVEDPIIEMGGNPNFVPLSENDGFDRGTLLHYYTTLPVDAFMGWKNNQSEFVFGSNVSVVNNVITVHEYATVHAGAFIGNGYQLSNINGSNVSLVPNANYSSYAAESVTVSGSSQPNITSLGTLTELTVTGNITGANILGNIQANGSTGELQFKDSTGYLGSRPQLTFDTAQYKLNVGDGSGGNVVSDYFYAVSAITTLGNITSANANLGNQAIANYFIGSGNNLSNIQAANITGIVANANYSDYAGNSIFSENANIANSANTANYANISNVAGTVTSSSQPNITSVGALTNLTVTGNIGAGNITVSNTITATDATITGNLVVNGNTTYVNVTELVVEDPIISLGNGPNNQPLTANDGKDRGTLLNYYTNEPKQAFVGMLNATQEFIVASDVTITNDVVIINELANLRANNIIGNITGNFSGNIVVPGSNGYVVFNGNGLAASSSNLIYNIDDNKLQLTGSIEASDINVVSNISATNVSATTFTGNLVGNATHANVVTYATQTAITRVGTLTVLDVVGNITSGNADLGNLTTSNYFAGVLITASQPNITSVGILTSLDVSGNITSGNANLGNLATANYFAGDGSGLYQINGSNVSEVPLATFATNANYAEYSNIATTAVTVTDSSQPNITSVGTLNGLTVTGFINASLGASLGNSVTSNYFVGDGGFLSNITASNIIGTVSYANFSDYAGNATDSTNAINVTGSSQPNITSVGILTSLDVSGTITSGNASLGNAVSANFFIGDGGFLSNIATGEFANYANYAGNSVNAEIATTALTVTEGAQPNITSVGVLDQLIITGNLTAGNIDGGNLLVANYIQGDGSYLSNLPGSAITGWAPRANYSNYSGNAVTATFATTAGNANLANYAINITGSSQPNITTVGTLVDLNVAGNVYASNALFGNGVAAMYYSGDGGNLSNINGANVFGIVAEATYAEYSNIANTAANANLANTVVLGSQPNITSVGTLTSLQVSGSATLADVSASNITVGAVTITSSNVTADNIFGNISSPGFNTSVIFNNAGFMGATNSLQFDYASNILTITGDLAVTNSITRDGKDVPTHESSSVIPINPVPGDEWYDQLNDRIYKYVFDGLSYAWLDISSGFISACVSATANTLVLRDGNANIYGNTISGNVLLVAERSELGNVGNVKITGGSANYILQTDGSGNLSWVNAGSQGVAGSNTQVQFNNSGSFGASANFTFDTTTETLRANYITANSNLKAEAGYLYLSNTMIGVENANAGIFTSNVANINLGLQANLMIGSPSGEAVVRGNFYSNNISTQGNLVVEQLATITNLKVNDLYSNRTPISVTNNTIIDSFTVNKYRSAKYTMRVNSDDGYQAVEVLLIHDGTNSYVTIYGSLSTIGTDIITLSTAINSGNVQLLATTTSTNTTVNLLGTYVAD